MKTCNVCKLSKSEEEFSLQKVKGRYYRRYCCQICDSKRNRQWREKNRMKSRDTRNKWREKNKQQAIKIQRKYYYNNVSKLAEKQRIWFTSEANLGKRREYDKRTREIIKDSYIIKNLKDQGWPKDCTTDPILIQIKKISILTKRKIKEIC